MENKTQSNQGLKRMVELCRAEFEIPENTDYYENYREAERKYVKFCLLQMTN
jgi:hypothetical protein